MKPIFIYICSALIVCFPVISSAQQSYLEIATEPPGAKISIDGIKTKKTTPCYITLQPGIHEIIAEKKSYVRTIEKITIEPGQFKSLKLNLVKLSGIEIRTQPNGAALVIKKLDGEKRILRRTSPINLTDINQGRYELTIKKARFKTIKTEIEVTEGPFRRTYVLFEKKPDTVEVFKKDEVLTTEVIAAPSKNRLKTLDSNDKIPFEDKGVITNGLSSDKGPYIKSKPLIDYNLEVPSSSDKGEKSEELKIAASEKTKIERNKVVTTKTSLTTDDGLITLEIAIDKSKLGINDVLDLRILFYGKNFGLLPELSKPSHDGFRIGGPSSSSKMVWMNGGFNPVKNIIYKFYPTEAGTFEVGKISFSYRDERYTSEPFQVTVIGID